MFQGFCPETIDFLWGIRMNNERTWFQAHKQQYLTTLYEPMKALGQELYRPFADRPGCIMKVSRIYRDARMHHPDPYKESLWICIRQDVSWWAENPCLYFEIRPEGASCGFSFWRPRPAAMEAFRRDIAARPEPFLELLARTRQATGMELTARCYKRPKGTPEDPRLTPYFSWREDVSCVREIPAGPELFDPALSGQVSEFFVQLSGLYDYFCRFGE